MGSWIKVSCQNQSQPINNFAARDMIYELKRGDGSSGQSEKRPVTSLEVT